MEHGGGGSGAGAGRLREVEIRLRAAVGVERHPFTAIFASFGHAPPRACPGCSVFTPGRARTEKGGGGVRSFEQLIAKMKRHGKGN